MIRWTGEGNRVQPEFSALDRYFELWDQHIGPPRKVVFYIVETGWWRDRGRPVRVTTDNRPGEPGGTVVEWPHFSQPGQAERWRGAIGGTLQRMRARGWNDTELLIGVVGDERNFSNEMVRFFEVAAPGLSWATFTHGRGDPRIPTTRGERHTLGPFSFSFVEFPYSPDHRRQPREPLNNPPSPKRDAFPFLTTFREKNSQVPFTSGSPGFFFFYPFASRQDPRRDYAGFGRMGVDFWRLDGPGRSIIGMHERWHNLYRDNPRHMFHPGPNGALASQQTELLREGSVMAEAMLILHEAVTLPEFTERLPSHVREAAREAYMGMYSLFYESWSGESRRSPEQIAFLETRDWQTPLLAVYNAAGSVASALGQTTTPARAVPPDVPRMEGVGETRVWTSATGQQIRARFLGFREGQVGLELDDGRRQAIPLDRFSEEDINWVRERQ